MQTNAAYDLERFAPREQKPRLRVAGQPKPKRGLARYNLKWIKAVAFASVFLALVCSVLYSQVQSTELSAQIRTQEDTLADLQSEYTYLSNEMEMKTNLSAVQEYATNTLKMVKMDRSQVTYVTTGQENKVERSDTGLAAWRARYRRRWPALWNTSRPESISIITAFLPLPSRSCGKSR